MAEQAKLEVRKFKGIYLRRPLENTPGKLIVSENVVTSEEGFLQSRAGVAKARGGGAWTSYQESISTTANGTTTLTGGANAFANVQEGDWIRNPSGVSAGVTEGTYVVTKVSATQLTLSAAVTAGTEPQAREFWRSDVQPFTKSGKIVGAHTHRSTRPYIYHLDNAGSGTLAPSATPMVESGDMSEQCWWPMFSSPAVGKCVAIVAPRPFSSFTLDVGIAAANITISWYYSSTNGWRALNGMPAYASVAVTTASPQVPKSGLGSPAYTYDWGPTALKNGVYGYAIIGIISAIGGGPISPRMRNARIHGDFVPRQHLIVASSDVWKSGISTRIHRWGQGYAGVTPVVRHYPVDLGAGSGMETFFDGPVQFASNDGVLYHNNGAVMRRHQGDPALNANVGFPRPSYPPFACAVSGGVGTGVLTGDYIWAMRYGYGPGGGWGKGTCIIGTDASWPGSPNVVGCATQNVNVYLPAELTAGSDGRGDATHRPGIVDVVHIYRSVDLTGGRAMSYAAAPFFKVGEVTRQADGTFPVSWLDQYTQNMIPTESLDIRDFTPPEKIRFMGLHKDRMLYVASRQFPSRIWRSEANNWEAVDQAQYIDFARSSGGDITAWCPDFADMAVVFTEDSFYGVSAVDQDEWGAQLISNEVGCVAPESVVSAYGSLFWLSKLGVVRWNGENPPEIISKGIRMENCSFQHHGRSRAIAYNFLYELELMADDKGFSDRSALWPSTVYCDLSDAKAAPTSTKYVYSIRTKEWQTTKLNMTDPLFWQPIATVTWPADATAAGRKGPLYGRFREESPVASATINAIQYAMGDSGTTDDAGTISFIVDVPFGPYGDILLKPFTLVVECKGITSLAASVVNSNVVGYKPSLVTETGAKLKDVSDSLDVYEIPFKDPGMGVADLIIRLTGVLEPTYERNAFIHSVTLRGSTVQRKLMGVGVTGV